MKTLFSFIVFAVLIMISFPQIEIGYDYGDTYYYRVRDEEPSS